MRWVKKQFWFLARFASYFTMNLLWPLFFQPLCKLLKNFNHPPFGFIFLVYPGTLDQVKGYAPLWYRQIAPMVSVIGLVFKARNGQRGLVVSIPWTIEEMEDEGRLGVMLKMLNRLAEKIGAKSIALAGRLPGVIAQNGHREMLVKPIVTGERGTIFTIFLSAKQAVETAGLNFCQVKVGILGYGFIGSRLVSTLQDNGIKNIVCVDPRIKQDRNNHLTLTRDPMALAGMDLVVILTAKGEQAETVIDYLKPGVLIIDDTHPQLPRRLSARIEKAGGRVIKATLGMEGMVFWPRLPKWDRSWLPGCCVEALVSATQGFTMTQKEFNQQAEQMGFVALEVTNRSDL